MNSTKLASRLVFMAKQLRGEADRQQNPEIRDDLIRGSRQLTYAFRTAYSHDPEEQAVAVALVDGAIDYLVGVMTARYERELEAGATP